MTQSVVRIIFPPSDLWSDSLIDQKIESKTKSGALCDEREMERPVTVLQTSSFEQTIVYDET